MNTTEEIVQFLIQKVKSSGPISGARLGLSVKTQFPGFDWKQEFRSLHGFIQRHCSREVVLVSATPDHMWAIADTSGARVDGTLSGPPATVWQALVNERTPDRLFVSSETGEVSVVSASVLPPEACVEIQKITHDDHLQIARGFLAQVDAPDQVHFQAVLGKPDYWQHWNNELRFVKGGQYLVAWHEFRVQKIYDLYAGRLRAAGIQSEEVIARSVEGLKRLRVEARNQRKRMEWPMTKALHKPVPEIPRECQAAPLRAAALEAVKALSEEDLRRLWLPLGVVSDALRRG